MTLDFKNLLATLAIYWHGHGLHAGHAGDAIVVSGSDDGSVDLWTYSHAAMAPSIQHVDGQHAHDDIVSSKSEEFQTNSNRSLLSEKLGLFCAIQWSDQSLAWHILLSQAQLLRLWLS